MQALALLWRLFYNTSLYVLLCGLQAFFDAVDGMRVAIGPGVVFRYVILGLFHPARKVSYLFSPTPSPFTRAVSASIARPEFPCVDTVGVTVHLLVRTVVLAWCKQGVTMGAPVVRIHFYCRCAVFMQVREVYWRVYNNVYIGHQDAMVAFFPRLPDDGKHSFARHELELVI